MQDTKAWAESQFGSAKLGDARRVSRLVKLAEEAASTPAGTITNVCATSASREGAFRLLENKAVRPEAIRAAIADRTRVDSVGARRVIVPIDATSLTLGDEARTRQLGAVGSWKSGSRGIHAMTALVVREDGSTIGMGTQRMWVREKKKTGTTPETSENRFWLELLDEVHSSYREMECQPWFQLDRGADCAQVLALGVEREMLMTVRATHDRRLDEQTRRLWGTLQHAPVRATRKVEVSARAPGWRKKRKGEKRTMIRTPRRKARVATVTMRSARVAIECMTPNGKRILPMNAVYVREKGQRQDRVEWMLLTTHPIETTRHVCDVVKSYALRWRIEEFHRMWKRGYCRVEDTQLQSRSAITKWATILAAVATRAMRLTHLARTTPDVSALTEFSATELRAIIALRQPKGIAPDHTPTLGVAVRWLAEFAGHAGPWSGHPGPTLVGRGLRHLAIAARAFEFSDKSDKR